MNKVNKNKKNNASNIIALVAGGTGGHIFPAIATAENLIENGYKIVFFTDYRFHNFAKYFVNITSNESFHLIFLDASQAKRGFIAKFKNYLKTLLLIYKSFNLLKIFNVKLVIGFGSYTSLPVILGSFLRGIPSLIHEQNSFLGFSNRISSIFTKAVMTSFPSTQGFYRFTIKKAIFIGMPIRKDILQLYYQNTNSNINYNAFFRTFERINIVVLGGSQGAEIFSKIIPEALKFLNKDMLSKIFIYHQCRDVDVDKLAIQYQEIGIKYHINTFFQDPGKLMTMAHLIITRSGAGTLFDVAVCGSPCLLVPYKYAKNNHQYLNAKYFYQHGSALLLQESQFKSEKVSQIMSNLFNNDYELLTLSNNIKSLAVINAHEKILNMVKTIINIDDDVNKKEFTHRANGVRTGEVGIG